MQRMNRSYHRFQIVTRRLDFAPLASHSYVPLVVLRWRQKRGSDKRFHLGLERQGMHGPFPSSLVFDDVPHVRSIDSARMVDACHIQPFVLPRHLPWCLVRLSTIRAWICRVDVYALVQATDPSTTNNLTPTGRLTFVLTGPDPRVVSSSSQLLRFRAPSVRVNAVS